MKKIIYLLFVTLLIGSISSCKDMDGTYKEFLVPNGLKYPQKPDSLKVFAGYNKLRLTWLQAKDPSVVRAEIYWNNYLDTMKIDIPKNVDTIKIDIPNMNEGTYTFYVKTFDVENNASIPSEVTGTSYGANFLLSATDRTISSALRDETFNGTVTWNAKTSDLVYSEVRYQTASGQIKTVRAYPEDGTLKCPDIKVGAKFEYRSVFLPKNGIDSIGRDWITFDKPFMYKYPRNTWTAVAKNGNHDWGDGGGGQPALIFDGNTATGWHSKVGTSFPQCIVADMKQQLIVDNITIYPPAPTNWRYLKNIKIYLTDDPINPNDANLTTILSPIIPIAEVLYPGGASFSIELTTPKTGQYMTLLFPDGTAAYISFMELEVYGY